MTMRMTIDVIKIRIMLSFDFTVTVNDAAPYGPALWLDVRPMKTPKSITPLHFVTSTC